jgi:hypothetical protein
MTTIESIYLFVDIIRLNILVKVKVLEETIRQVFTQGSVYGSCDENILTNTYADHLMCYLHSGVC